MKNILMLFAGLAIFFSNCKNGQEYNIKSSDQYEQSKLTLEQTEQKHPARFLTISGSKKKNLLGQTVVKGNIINQGKISRFKDIEILLSFFSKTGALLEQDHDTVYETINPGGNASFKSKYFAPKGTDSIGLQILSAKF